MSSWEKILILMAWSGFAGVLAKVGVPAALIADFAAYLEQLGLLSVKSVSFEEMEKRATALRPHLKGL